MNGRSYLSNERAVPILAFLWTWKLVSTAALVQRFFPHITNPASAYNWLLDLKKAQYITTKADERGENRVWTLDRLGFRAIRDLLPDLREDGFLSEASHHDWLVTAFHLGDWLVQLPAGVQLFSEQQLRRLEIEHYPDWVPKDPRHRPDGYWHRLASTGPRIVALEVELSLKKSSKYVGVGSFYGESVQINRVIWVVRKLSDARIIQAGLDKGPGSRSIHSFVLLNSFLKSGWSAPVVQGPGGGLPVESFLRMALGNPENTTEVPTGCRGTVAALLETRIKRIQSVTSGARIEG